MFEDPLRPRRRTRSRPPASAAPSRTSSSTTGRSSSPGSPNSPCASATAPPCGAPAGGSKPATSSPSSSSPDLDLEAAGRRTLARGAGPPRIRLRRVARGSGKATGKEQGLARPPRQPTRGFPRRGGPAGVAALWEVPGDRLPGPRKSKGRAQGQRRRLPLPLLRRDHAGEARYDRGRPLIAMATDRRTSPRRPGRDGGALRSGPRDATRIEASRSRPATGRRPNEHGGGEDGDETRLHPEVEAFARWFCDWWLRRGRTDGGND